MLIDKDSMVLYDTLIEEHQTQTTVFLRHDDGLCVRHETRGIEFFKILETLTPLDDLHKGIYPTIDTIPTQVSEALKEFTGYNYQYPDLNASILFQLLTNMKYLLTQEQD